MEVATQTEVRTGSLINDEVLDGKAPKKVIVVPQRIVNVVA